MKTSKLLSIAAAAAVAASVAAVPSSAEETVYNAYIGVQSASYSFRNAWNEPSYGKGVTGDDGMVYFDQITGWDGPTAISKGGVFTDAQITGDGTYSVSVTDFDFGEDESLNLLFVSTDIPLDAGVSITDVKVILDGNVKYTFDEAFLSPDELEYVQPMMINIWNSDLGGEEGLFGYTMPQDSIEIQFTVSGMGAASDAADDSVEEAIDSDIETTEDAPASDETTTPAATGNASAAAIAAVMAAAGAAAVLSKKRN
ncbi:MAG: hypothetical protein SOU50_05865 [Oscillospiraceae bacterium]|nr:hypothetical protein [Oscillospiraceae bacterium]MDY2847728.1 hypothetical protein [Oscillospiraceae bacterium]